MRALLLLCLAAAAVPAAEWVGFISDEACGWNNARNTKEAKQCARVCVKSGGWDPVLVPDGTMKTYKFTNKAKALPFVGEKVKITGTLAKEIVTIQTIRLIPAK